MIKIGDMVGGRYRIIRQIGEGGMASVWLAHDGTLQRNVAVKFVWKRDPRRHKEMVGGFLREARIAASVVHRNVVQVLDFGLLEDSTPYMVMEALEGQSLGDLFNDGAQFTLSEVDQIARRSLEGLIAVHEAGIVHRDLKPENLFVLKERDGYFPKLLDFGISKSLDPSGRRKSAVTTRDGRIVGTPEYMSPEQAAGTAAVERRTDIYSMGVILYETIAGDVPYKSDHLGGLIIQITSGKAPPIIELVPEVGQGVSDVIQKAMAPDPSERFAGAVEMSEAWAQAIDRRKSRHPSALPARNTDRRKRTQITETGDEDGNLDLPPGMSLTPGQSADSVRSVPPPPTALSVSSPPAPASPPPPAGGKNQRDRHTLVINGNVLPGPILWGAAAIIIIAIAAISWAMKSPSTAPQGNKFIVVQGNNSQEAAPAVAAPAPPTRPAPDLDTAQEAPAAHAPSKEAIAPSRPKKKGRPKPRAETSIARAFSRQKTALTQCFEAHTAAEEAQLSVRITIGLNGAVQKAEVSPPAYKALKIGTCIQNAVRAMKFPKQKTVSTFRVPLIARRGS